MAKRNIVHIDEARCDGCGLCAAACIEGAIQIQNGQARLISESYCDGLGACLGECPQGAITIEVREADAFDPQAVEERLAKKENQALPMMGGGKRASAPHACPGAAPRVLATTQTPTAAAQPPSNSQAAPATRLVNWPVQLALVPERSPLYAGAHLLITADCVPVATPDWQARFLSGQHVIIGCPKLDDTAGYRRKLAAILAGNDIQSVRVLHMEVPCCFGLVRLVQLALEDSGKDIPFSSVKLSVRGEALDRA